IEALIATRLPMSFVYQSLLHRRQLPPSPTRRSSDLLAAHALRLVQVPQGDVGHVFGKEAGRQGVLVAHQDAALALLRQLGAAHIDRKSTRLNSSHVKISYAVLCLKKKKEYDVIKHDS